MPLLTVGMNQDNPQWFHSDASQEGMILEYLQQGFTLTGLQALKLFSTMRLGARVWTLKREGWKIESDWVEVGTRKRVKRYFLAQQK